MKPRNFYILIAAVVIVSGAAVFIAFGSGTTSTTTYSSTLTTDTVKVGDLEEIIYISGSISSGSVITVYTEESGTVVSAKEFGDKIKSGAVLAEVEVESGDSTFTHYPYSEITGYITEMKVSEGDRVIADQTAIAVVSSSSSYQIEATVSASDIIQIKKGQAASITISGIDETVAGKVTSRKEVPNQDGTYTIVITPDEIPSGTLLGFETEIEVTVDSATNVLYVDNVYLETNDAGEQYVTTIDTDGNTAEVIVETGFENDTYTEITSGLEEGTEIVLPTLAATTSDSDSNSNQRGGFEGGPGGDFGGGAGVLGGNTGRF